MTKILLALYFVSLFVIGCSAPKESVQSIVTDDTSVALLNDKNFNPSVEAMDQFINGSLAEAKGDYANAIIDYQDALRISHRPGIYFALAKNYFYLNKLSLALENSKTALKLDSSKIDYYNLLADIYTSGKQYDSAAVVLSSVIRHDSSDIDAYYKLARIYESDKPLKAIKIYNKITGIIGPDWSVLIRVAELNANLGNYDDAASSIKQLLTIDPSNSSLQKLLAEYFQRAKKYDDALKIINDVISLYPDDLDARERKAQIYLAEDKWKEAADQYDYIIKQHDVPFDIKMRIGASFFEASLKDSTLTPITKNFFRTIEKDTTNWQVKMYLGAIAINERNDSAAIREFSAATKLASWNVEAWVRLGGLYFDNRKYVDAVKVMDEAIKTFPEDFRVNLILGLSLTQSNKNVEAKKYLKKAVDLNPKDINALSAYSFTLSQLKENDEAIIYLNKALEISPDDVNLLGTLGLIYDSQKDWPKCDSVYQRALKIDSSNALVNNNYAYSLSERGIKLDEAKQMSEIAIKADPANSAYLDTMGWIYFKMGVYDKAKDYVEKALKSGGEKPDILDHLGDIEFKMGDKDKAKTTWQKALKQDKGNSKLKVKIEKGIN